MSTLRWWKCIHSSVAVLGSLQDCPRCRSFTGHIPVATFPSHFHWDTNPRCLRNSCYFYSGENYWLQSKWNTSLYTLHVTFSLFSSFHGMGVSELLQLKDFPPYYLPSPRIVLAMRYYGQKHPKLCTGEQHGLNRTRSRRLHTVWETVMDLTISDWPGDTPGTHWNVNLG